VLLLDEPSDRLTERFHGGQVGPHSLEEHPVLTRWARVARLGLAPDSSDYPDVTSSADLHERRDRFDDIFRQRQGPLDQVAAELASRDVITLLADPEGVIIASRGGGTFRDGAGNARLIEGARWSETARGTNAIGTAATEGTAVAVVGRAHYELRNTGLFCYATPVRDPYGELAAVLDVSGSMAHHDPAIASAVQLAGGALERLLRAQAFARTHAGGLAVLEKLVARSRAPALLAEASGGVRIANAAARAILRAGVAGAAKHPRSAEGHEGLTCEQIFGVRFQQLAAMALAGRGRARFEAQAISCAAELDPLFGPDGRALALVVYLEPVVQRRSLSSVRPLRLPVSVHPAFAPLLGTDPPFLRAKALAERFAATQLPVLLLAETGTGKELFARAIHGASATGRGPFVALNCGALSDSLLESELFGYAPGAFTGASRTGSLGKLGAANGGTLFLDEVAEMPEALQSTLLRVLDDGVYYRVGEGRPRSSEFRLVCATSRDLPALIERGAFRRDLFYRIHGACVTIPALRDRTDRLLLAKALLAKLQSADAREIDPVALAEDASLWIEEHTWPGNVRELRSALLHALALADGGPIAKAHFPEILISDSSLKRDADRGRAPGERTKNELLRDEYATTIEACSGNVAEAARRLGVARSTLYRTLKR
jgi:transcriptional regulator of acetoin/glycerol metabolism